MGNTTAKSNSSAQNERKPPPLANKNSAPVNHNPLLPPLPVNNSAQAQQRQQQPKVQQHIESVLPLSTDERAAITLSTVERLLKLHALLPQSTQPSASKQRDEAERRKRGGSMRDLMSDRGSNFNSGTADASFALASASYVGVMNKIEGASNNNNYNAELDTRNNSVTSLVAPKSNTPSRNPLTAPVQSTGGTEETGSPKTPALSVGKASTLPPQAASASFTDQQPPNGGYVGFSASISSQLPQPSLKTGPALPLSPFASIQQLNSPPHSNMNLINSSSPPQPQPNILSGGNRQQLAASSPTSSGPKALPISAVDLQDLHYKLLVDIVAKTNKDPYALDVTATLATSRQRSSALLAANFKVPKREKVHVSDIVSSLVTDYKVNINAQSSRYGLSPLHAAAHEGNFACIKAFADQEGASVNLVDYEGNTPLFRATSMHAALMLIELGADIFWQNKHGKTFLHNSSTKKGIESVSVKQLLVAAARVEMQRAVERNLQRPSEATTVGESSLSASAGKRQAAITTDDSLAMANESAMKAAASASDVAITESDDNNSFPISDSATLSRPKQSIYNLYRFGISTRYTLVSHPPPQEVMALVRLMEQHSNNGVQRKASLVSPTLSNVRHLHLSGGKFIAAEASTPSHKSSERNSVSGTSSTSTLSTRQFLSAVFLDPKLHFLTPKQRQLEFQERNVFDSHSVSPASPSSPPPNVLIHVTSPNTDAANQLSFYSKTAEDDNYLKFDDPNHYIKRLLNVRDSNGDTALHTFSRLKHEEVPITIPYITQLITLGADVNYRNNRGEVPMMIALRNESALALKVFVRSAGAECGAWTSTSKPQMKRYYNLVMAARRRAVDIDRKRMGSTDDGNPIENNNSSTEKAEGGESAADDASHAIPEGTQQLQRARKNLSDELRSPMMRRSRPPEPVVDVRSDGEQQQSAEDKRDVLPHFGISGGGAGRRSHSTNPKVDDQAEKIPPTDISKLRSSESQGMDTFSDGTDRADNFGKDEKIEEMSIEEQFEQLDAFGAEDDEPRENSYGDGASSTNTSGSMRSRHYPFYHSTSHSPPRTLRASNPVKHPLVQMIDIKKAKEGAAAIGTSYPTAAGGGKSGTLVLNQHQKFSNDNKGLKLTGIGKHNKHSSSHSSSSTSGTGALYGHSLLDDFEAEGEEFEQSSMKNEFENESSLPTVDANVTGAPPHKPKKEGRKGSLKSRWRNDYEQISAEEEAALTEEAKSGSSLKAAESENIQILSDTARPSDSPAHASASATAGTNNTGSLHKAPLAPTQPVLPPMDAFLSTATGTIYDHIAAMRNTSTALEFFKAFIEAVNDAHKWQRLETELLSKEPHLSASDGKPNSNNLFFQAAHRSLVGTPLHYALANMQTPLIEACLTTSRAPGSVTCSKRSSDALSITTIYSDFPFDALDVHQRTPLHIVVAFVEILCNSNESNGVILACESPHMANRDAATGLMRLGTSWSASTSRHLQLMAGNSSSQSLGATAATTAAVLKGSPTSTKGPSSKKKISFEGVPKKGMAERNPSVSSLNEASAGFAPPERQLPHKQVTLSQGNAPNVMQLQANAQRRDFLRVQLNIADSLLRSLTNGTPMNNGSGTLTRPMVPLTSLPNNGALEIYILQIDWCLRVTELLLRDRLVISEGGKGPELRMGSSHVTLDGCGHTPFRQLIAALVGGGHLATPDSISLAIASHSKMGAGPSTSNNNFANTTLNGSSDPVSTDDKSTSANGKSSLFDIMRTGNQQVTPPPQPHLFKQLSATSAPSHSAQNPLAPLLPFQAAQGGGNTSSATPLTATSQQRQSPTTSGPPSYLLPSYCAAIISYSPWAATRFIDGGILSLFLKHGGEAIISDQKTIQSHSTKLATDRAVCIPQSRASLSVAASPLHIVAAQLSISVFLRHAVSQLRRRQGDQFMDSAAHYKSDIDSGPVEGIVTEEKAVWLSVLKFLIDSGADTDALYGYRPRQLATFSPPASFKRQDEESTETVNPSAAHHQGGVSSSALPLLTPLQLMVVRSLPNYGAVEEALAHYQHLADVTNKSSSGSSGRKEGTLVQPDSSNSGFSGSNNNNNNTKLLAGAEEVVSTAGDEVAQQLLQNTAFISTVDEKVIGFAQLVSIVEFLSADDTSPRTVGTRSNEGHQQPSGGEDGSPNQRLSESANNNQNNQSTNSKNSAAATASSVGVPSQARPSSMSLMVPLHPPALSSLVQVPALTLLPNMVGEFDPCFILADRCCGHKDRLVGFLIDSHRKKWRSEAINLH